MRRRRQRGGEAVNHERWLISYADFITLLFAFFVTMYAISTVDQRKLEKAVAAFQQAFAEHQVTDATLMAVLPEIHTVTEPAGSLADVRERLARRLAQLGEHRVELSEDRRGLVITVREAGSFETGRADLDEDARRVFHEIGVTLIDIPHAIRVEGHTDDVPIHTPRFASNWELSTARATTVVAFFIEQIGISPDRLSAAGYGEFHPRVPNDSDANRARNRRVDIVVLNPQVSVQEEPRAAAEAAR
ncbi:MAG TPA: flagellar motor protein MotB [Vicinamibacterales bacterium]